MKLEDIRPAIALVQKALKVTDLRKHTYLATYPGMISIGAASGSAHDKFHQLATLVYGWMPRVIRIDPNHRAAAVEAFKAALSAKNSTISHAGIQSIADCLHSVVGASKLLHFANPDTFPIWDSNIEAFRNQQGSDLTEVSQYLDYVKEVHNIRGESEFKDFYDNFNIVYSKRLSNNNIPIYTINEVRAIESAAFELSP